MHDQLTKSQNYMLNNPANFLEQLVKSQYYTTNYSKNGSRKFPLATCHSGSNFSNTLLTANNEMEVEMQYRSESIRNCKTVSFVQTSFAK